MSATLREQLKRAREKLFPRDANPLGCGKKTRYPDAVEAEEIRKKRERRAGHPIWKYRCSSCSGWHLSKLKPPQES